MKDSADAFAAGARQFQSNNDLILSGDPKKGAEAFQQIMDSVAGMDPTPHLT